MCIGSPQGGCKPTISSNTFTGNTAKYTVRAIPLHRSAAPESLCIQRWRLSNRVRVRTA